MTRNIAVFLVLTMLFATACEKPCPKPTPMTPPPAFPTTPMNLVQDSVYLYSKEVYLWEDLIPSMEKFDPRRYYGSSELKAASNVMNAIRQLQPLDRFSFVTTRATSQEIISGDGVSYGFLVKAASIDQALPIDSIHWFVSYVYDESPAAKNGVVRGWYLNKVEGTVMDYSQSSVDILNTLLFGNYNSANLEFIKPDGTSVVTHLSKTKFAANSVLHKSVIDDAGKKIGYIVFNQFFGEPSRTELTAAFNYFEAEAINELIVDLRYNTGGSTQTQDALANLIAPLSANGADMYKYIFNPKMQQDQFSLLRQKYGVPNGAFHPGNNTIKFKKAGALNLNRVFFITSRSSASASELLINNLRPYMDVKLIGDTTFGKPVGYFPINIFDYSIFPVSFKTVNSIGTANYYQGFPPDWRSPDGVNKNWGDNTEPCLASAIKFINTGNFRLAPRTSDTYEKRMKIQEQLDPLTEKIEANKFSGMFIENK